MYTNLQEDITNIIYSHAEKSINDVTRMDIEGDIILYLNNLTIEKELFPYELKLKNHINLTEIPFVLHIGIYHTQNKYFVEPDMKEWNSYKIQQIVKKFNL